MPVIKILIFVILGLAVSAHAADEYWEIIQIKTGSMLFEYIERDKENFFQTKNLNFVRFSYGEKIGSVRYLLGGGYVQFSKGPDERRLHQFLLYNQHFQNVASLFYRLGLEQRSFLSDEQIYARARLRVQINPLSQHAAGFAIYNESFYTFDGHGKFANGFNENRFGLGLRFISSIFETYLYHTETDLSNLKSQDHFRWIQFQLLLNF